MRALALIKSSGHNWIRYSVCFSIYCFHTIHIHYTYYSYYMIPIAKSDNSDFGFSMISKCIFGCWNLIMTSLRWLNHHIRIYYWQALNADFDLQWIYTAYLWSFFSTGDVSFPRFRILLISKLPCIPGWLHNEQNKYGGALNEGLEWGGHECRGPWTCGSRVRSQVISET